MKIIGLDLGSKRVGVAVSDALKITAQGQPFIEKMDDDRTIAAIGEVVRCNSAVEIVIGLPLNMDGSEGPQAIEAKRFAELVKQKLNINVQLWDERLTTRQVERIMIQANTSRQKRKTKIDSLSAQLILQSYLDSISFADRNSETD